MSVITEKRLAEVVYTVNKIYAGKCMNEHAARSILSNIIHLLGSKADINECEVKYHRGKYLNSFFIKIRGNSILFTIDIAEDNRIEKFDYTKTTFIQWLNENSEEMKPMETAKKSIEDTLESLSKYYTGQVNSLDNASEMFKGLISVYGLVVPADDILICKSLVVPAIFIQGKGKVNLIELHECERGLIINVVYNVELVHMFLKQYKTKEETKMKEIKYFNTLPQIGGAEVDASTEYKPLLDILRDVKSGDILERESDGQGVVLDGTIFSWYDIEEGRRTGTIPLTTGLLATKFRLRPAYVGWQEAFEAYENGYTIMCEYKGDMLELNRDLVTLQERNLLSDRELIGLLTTKWIIK